MRHAYATVASLLLQRCSRHVGRGTSHVVIYPSQRRQLDDDQAQGFPEERSRWSQRSDDPDICLLLRYPPHPALASPRRSEHSLLDRTDNDTHTPQLGKTSHRTQIRRIVARGIFVQRNGVGWHNSRRVRARPLAAGEVPSLHLSNSSKNARMASDLEAAAVGEQGLGTLLPVSPFPVTRSVNPRLAKVFRRQDGETQEAAFIAYLTAGYPKKTDTVELLLALQEGGVDVVELGVPFSDPQADGPTIQATNQVALLSGITLTECLEIVRDARAKGLTIAVVLMGYLNPFLAYGLNKLVHDAHRNGVDGFLVVDLLPDDAHDFISKCHEHHLSFIPLVTPTTTDGRIPFIASATDSFVYCVSVTGVTGARAHLPTGLEKFIRRVRRATGKPLSVGFGISSTEQVQAVARIADGVVVGSAFMNAIDEVASDAPASEIAAHLRKYTSGLRAGVVAAAAATATATTTATSVESKTPSKQAYRMRIEGERKAVPPGGNIGTFGGCYIPETLVEAHRGLEEAYAAAMADPGFREELARSRREYIGGPTPLHHAKNLSGETGGAQIWLKREEMAYTGAQEINNAMAQALLAKRVGKTRVVAATGSGQHGVATATACALLGMECTVFMGAVDCQRQKLNLVKMKILGAQVVPVEQGGRKLKDAINEAMRHCVATVSDTYFLCSSTVAPHPFPTMVREFQSVVGEEALSQVVDHAGRLPDYVVAGVGEGSDAIGMFDAFLRDDNNAGHVRLVGVEAGGKGNSLQSAAALTRGSPGVLHGTRTYILQDEHGQISDTHSIAAGLDYPGVGPEHSRLKDTGRAEYIAVDDAHAIQALQLLARTEGIISALEPAHAVYHAMQLAKGLPPDKIVLVNLSGRGDKDMETVAAYLGEAI